MHVISLPEPQYLSIPEAARLVSLSPTTIRRMIDSGRLKACRPTAGRVVISRQALINAVEGGPENDPLPPAA